MANLVRIHFAPQLSLYLYIKILMINDILYNPEHSYYGRIKNIALGFLVMVVWNYIILHLLNYIQPPEPPSIFDGPPDTAIWLLFFCVISAPLWEEVVFRWFPLYCTKTLAKEYKIPIILATSAIFGYLHGGPEHVWIQGVAGLIFACVYIKNGYHYWSSVILHAVWNYMVCFGFHSL